MMPIADAKAKIKQVRAREEKRLINLAHKSGFFETHLTSLQIKTMFTDQLEQITAKKQSQLSRLETEMQKTKKRLTDQERRDDARRKILLGSFIIAQMEHKPVLKAELLPELVTFLELHKDANVVKNNKALLKEWIGEVK